MWRTPRLWEEEGFVKIRASTFAADVKGKTLLLTKKDGIWYVFSGGGMVDLGRYEGRGWRGRLIRDGIASL